MDKAYTVRPYDLTPSGELAAAIVDAHGETVIHVESTEAARDLCEALNTARFNRLHKDCDK